MAKTLSSIYDPEAFRALGHQLIDILADHHQESLGGGRSQTIPWVPPDEQRAFWQGLDTTDIDIAAVFQHILSRSVAVHDPRYLGHQVGVPAPVSVLFGLLSSYLSNGMAVYEMGMPANCLETLIVEALCARVGFLPETSGGIFTSGGTLANLTALLTARRAMASRWQGKRPAVLVSEEAHYCIERAAITMGWDLDDVIKVPVDDAFGMRTDLLEGLYQDALARGQQVIAAIGCACSTSTGSYDDLTAIAAFCEVHGLWFHVDGAHGAAAIFSATHAPLLDGIDRADSIVLDFHKLLMSPALATALLYKHNEASFQTFQQEASYLLDRQRDWYNSGKRTFECTKYMMAARVYGFIKAHGWDAFGENVDVLFANARAFAAQIERIPGLVLGAPVQSNIICFRYEQEGLSLDASNQQNAYIRQAIVEDGAFYIVQTTLRGKLHLRLAVMNPFTTAAHIESLCQRVARYAEAWTLAR